MEKVKAVVCDIDNTLCRKGGDLMPVTRSAIQRLHQEGILFGVATGRPAGPRTLANAEKWKLGFPLDIMIGMNGGDLYDRFHEGIQHIDLLKKECIHEILDFLSPYDVNAIIYRDEYRNVLTLRMDPLTKDSMERNHAAWHIVSREEMEAEDTGKLEIRYDPSIEQELLKTVRRHACSAWNAVRTFQGTIEFQDPHVSKGNALNDICKRNKLSVDEVIAFGDMENDISMLITAGLGVCMCNGSAEAKKAANAITDYDVSNDGVGRYLIDHVFPEILD